MTENGGNNLAKLEINETTLTFVTKENGTNSLKVSPELGLRKHNIDNAITIEQKVIPENSDSEEVEVILKQ